jgi:ElaB/YqjD/DUF883 family membrane-anchored ribosome-binding protein
MRGESEAEVLERIEATRARMGETISRIGDRVNPDRVQRVVTDNIKQKARDTMRGMEHEVSEKGRGIWNTIRENPLPAGMVGIGLAWLLANGSTDDDSDARRRTHGYNQPHPYNPARPYGDPLRPHGDPLRPHGDPAFGYPTGAHAAPYSPEAARTRGGDREHGLRDRAEDLREGADEAMHAARDKASDAADRASEAWHEAQDRASETWHEAQERVEHAAHEVGHRARRVERRVEHMVEDNPLAAGMVAAALGFAAGLVIPETQREHEIMGDARDRMVNKAQRALHEARDTAQDVARETASTAAERVVDEAFGDGEDRGHSPMTEPGR